MPLRDGASRFDSDKGQTPWASGPKAQEIEMRYQQASDIRVREFFERHGDQGDPNPFFNCKSVTCTGKHHVFVNPYGAAIRPCNCEDASGFHYRVKPEFPK